MTNACKSRRRNCLYCWINKTFYCFELSNDTIIPKQRRNLQMIQLSQEAQKIMTERFGKDTIIALATNENGIPNWSKPNRRNRRGLVHRTWNRCQSGCFSQRRKSSNCRKTKESLCPMDKQRTYKFKRRKYHNPTHGINGRITAFAWHKVCILSVP